MFPHSESCEYEFPRRDLVMYEVHFFLEDYKQNVFLDTDL